MKVIDLIENMKKALMLMEKKRSESQEEILVDFIQEYKRVLSKLEEQKENIQSSEFGKIKSFTRMYMETSSDYRQEFLNAMSVVEDIIKKNNMLTDSQD